MCVCVSACVCEISVCVSGCVCVRNVLWVICTVGWECNNRLLMGLTETIRIKLTSDAEIQPRGPTQHKRHPTEYTQQAKHCIQHAKPATEYTFHTTNYTSFWKTHCDSALFVINNPVYLRWMLMNTMQMQGIAFQLPIRMHLNKDLTKKNKTKKKCGKSNENWLLLLKVKESSKEGPSYINHK